MTKEVSMFAILDRHQAIPGYSHGTVVSVHATEFDALIADARLQSHLLEAQERREHRSLVVVPLAVWRSQGEHVRLSDLVGCDCRDLACRGTTLMVRQAG
jgi:hypothetical protein